LSSSPPSPKATNFLTQVLARAPRLAVFDCDGTLWSGDAGMDFFYWEIEQGLISREIAESALGRYEQYKAGRVDEMTICGEMVTIHRGIRESVIREAAARFFHQYFQPRIFAELLELTRRLTAAGCELWAVSSTNNWVVEVGAELFGLPAERVLAASVAIVNGCASDRLLRVPTDGLKAAAIREVIQRPVDAIFGNSMHDLQMLEIARDPYAVNPNAELEREARQRGWTVYWPEATGR